MHSTNMTPKALSRKDIGHGVERTQENWKKEFDKKLPLFTFVNNSEYGSELKIEEVKDFISTLLAEERNKVIEKLDAMAFENDDGYKVELFINWDKAKEELKQP